jgi:hypothetical protein
MSTVHPAHQRRIIVAVFLKAAIRIPGVMNVVCRKLRKKRKLRVGPGEVRDEVRQFLDEEFAAQSLPNDRKLTRGRGRSAPLWQRRNR